MTFPKHMHTYILLGFDVYSLAYDHVFRRPICQSYSIMCFAEHNNVNTQNELRYKIHTWYVYRSIDSLIAKCTPKPF